MALADVALIFFGVIVGGVELSIFSANLLKIASGGWIPLLFATIVVIIMTTWRRGTAYIAKQRQDDEGRWTTSSTGCTKPSQPASLAWPFTRILGGQQPRWPCLITSGLTMCCMSTTSSSR